MTERQLRFAKEYAKSLNATQAAIYAGYSAKNARMQGARLMTKANIQAAVKEHQNAIAEKQGVEETFIIQGLIQEALGNGPDTTSAARIRSLELLGKHKGMFVERHDVRNLHAYADSAINEVEELVSDQ